jgi:uncharacterized membrane protein
VLVLKRKKGNRHISTQSIISKSRVEAFSDGVIAIIITIMVLEMKVPHGIELASLKPVFPVFLSYILSFVYLGAYWNNHHHLWNAAKHVNGKMMWANLHLLFWLSLIPFVTGWMGENPGTQWPTAFYGIVLLLAAVAYVALQGCIVQSHGKDSSLATSLGKDWKGKASLACYVSAIPFAFISPWISYVLYIGVLVLWFIPDRRVVNGVVRLDQN